MSKSIVIIGEAGQGIKQIGYILAKSLSRLDKEVSLNLSYGPAVRGGSIEVRLICSDDRIEIPLFEEADLLLKLSRKGITKAKAKEVIIEQSLCVDNPESDDPLC